MKGWLGLLLGLWICSGVCQELRLTIPLIDPGTGTFYVESDFGEGLATRMLVDTGSSFSTLSDALLRRLQRQDRDNVVYLRSQQGILADGQAISVPLYRIGRLRIGGRCVLENVVVAVFPHSRRAILGLNTLARLSPFSISIDPPEIHLNGCQGREMAAERKPSLAIAP